MAGAFVFNREQGLVPDVVLLGLEIGLTPRVLPELLWDEDVLVVDRKSAMESKLSDSFAC